MTAACWTVAAKVRGAFEWVGSAGAALLLAACRGQFLASCPVPEQTKHDWGWFL